MTPPRPGSAAYPGAAAQEGVKGCTRPFTRRSTRGTGSRCRKTNGYDGGCWALPLVWSLAVFADVWNVPGARLGYWARVWCGQVSSGSICQPWPVSHRRAGSVMVPDAAAASAAPTSSGPSPHTAQARSVTGPWGAQAVQWWLSVSSPTRSVSSHTSARSACCWRACSRMVGSFPQCGQARRLRTAAAGGRVDGAKEGFGWVGGGARRGSQRVGVVGSARPRCIPARAGSTATLTAIPPDILKQAATAPKIEHGRREGSSVQSAPHGGDQSSLRPDSWAAAQVEQAKLSRRAPWVSVSVACSVIGTSVALPRISSST